LSFLHRVYSARSPTMQLLLTTLLFSSVSPAVYATPFDFVKALANGALVVPLSRNYGGIIAGDLIHKEKSRHRARDLNPSHTVSATNEDVTYTVALRVGNQTFDRVIVDTGSANTWVGANTKYTSSPTGHKSPQNVSVSYGSGYFSGAEWTDNVGLGSLTVNQSVGIASVSTGFHGVDGILGLGPVGLTNNTVTNTEAVPTFTNNLLKKNIISKEVVGVYFAPGSDEANGELAFGGVNPLKYKGKLSYFPRVKEEPYGKYWGVATAGIKVNNHTLAGAGNAIVDTGTTLIYIPRPAFNAFVNATGGVVDVNSGLVAYNSTLPRPTQNFTINIGSGSGKSFSLTPNQWLIPGEDYGGLGLPTNKFYAWINDGGPVSSTGISFIIGQKFLENYYSVYDTTDDRIGFATRN